MTQDYKEKYPIGSKWETRGGDMAVVVKHGYSVTHPILVYARDNIWEVLSAGVSEMGELSIDLIKPWVEQEVDTVELVMIRMHDNKIVTGLKVSSLEHTIGGMDGVRGDVIASKTITITEGEGM